MLQHPKGPRVKTPDGFLEAALDGTSEIATERGVREGPTVDGDATLSVRATSLVDSTVGIKIAVEYTSCPGSIGVGAIAAAELSCA